MTVNKSTCCDSAVEVIHGDEGTSHWQCGTCHKPCDIKPLKKPTVDKWEEISKKLRLCPECWTLSERDGYCVCGGFKRLDFSDLPEKEQKMWIDGFERGESQSVQEAKAEENDRFLVLLDIIRGRHHKEHTCRFNDGEQSCGCYLEGIDRIKRQLKKIIKSASLKQEEEVKNAHGGGFPPDGKYPDGKYPEEVL